MKKIFLVFSISLLLTQIWAINKQKIALAGWRNTDYSVECVGTGNEGTQHLKVYFYFKKEKEAGLYAKKSAVDAVLFRGISAGVAGCFNQALVNTAQMEQNNSYFQNFFTPGGEYLSYISASTDQLTNRIKVGDRYKAAMEVSVNLSRLRKKMENDQIIQSLSSGF
jgi:hypothetical protein